MASTREAQRLLIRVGFPLVVDGNYGPTTGRAVTYFQEAWTFTALPVDGKFGAKTEAAVKACIAKNGHVSAHFTLPEFACNHCRWPRAHRGLLAGLEKYRAAHFTKSGLAIVSGYRCVAHNKAIGGAKGSQHIQGRAADVPPFGNGGKRVTVEMAARLGHFGGLEYQPRISGRGCTHVDTRAGGSGKNPTVFAW